MRGEARLFERIVRNDLNSPSFAADLGLFLRIAVNL